MGWMDTGSRRTWKTIALAALGVSTLSVGLALAQPAHRGPQGQGQGQHNGTGGQGHQGSAQGGQQQGGGQGGQQGGQQAGGQEGGPTSRPSLDALFDEADTNKDGSLSRDEFKTFLKSHRPPRPNGQRVQGGGSGGSGKEGGGEEGGNNRPPPPPDNQ